ncbi:MAG TPA: 50S ribosomal protein L19 [Bacteriovoracaceae bacterium]|nr:50S ribosomal protein L19 [Bacteriovoracaceae bacterium]
MNLVDVVESLHLNPNVTKLPAFRTGDTVEVAVRIKEGEKTRTQVFQGTCIAMKHPGRLNGHFRVRKISDGVGVERVFPFHSPAVEGVTIISKGKSRRAKHNYLRTRTGKAARVAIDYSR